MNVAITSKTKIQDRNSLGLNFETKYRSLRLKISVSRLGPRPELSES